VPSSHAVFGSAPMKTNSCVARNRFSSPVARARKVAPSNPLVGLPWRASSSHHDLDLSGVARQIYCGLAGGVSGTDQKDIRVHEELRFKGRRPVMDTCSFEVAEVIHIGPSVARTAREHDCSGAHGAGI